VGADPTFARFLRPRLHPRRTVRDLPGWRLGPRRRRKVDLEEAEILVRKPRIASAEDCDEMSALLLAQRVRAVWVRHGIRVLGGEQLAQKCDDIDPVEAPVLLQLQVALVARLDR
jgi:hypothetical protein